MSQVFRRFLYTSMYTWAYLPLFLFLWIKSLDSKNFVYLLFFLISSVLFTISFGHPAYLFAFWTTAIIFVFLKLWEVRGSKKELLRITLLSISAFCLWAIVNSWWLYPSVKSSGGFFTEIDPGWQIDFNSLVAVSKSFPINEILLLRQSWWFGKENHWFNFYSSPFIFAISLIVLVITIYGFIKLKKQPIWLYISLLFFVGLFVSKGTNFPLGEPFYSYLFTNFPIARVLRNSYEKFGIVFLLGYSCFFTYGIYQLIKIFNRKIRYIILSLMLILILGILVWPMWSGTIFLKNEKITVPSYYIEANNYLNSISDNRIFHLPLSKSGNVDYTWGYKGQDPSESLFNRISVSIPTFIPLRNIFYKDLPILTKDVDFPKILGLLGIGEVIVHTDAKIDSGDLLVNSEVVKSWEGLEGNQEFGNLRIYSIKKEYIRPKIYSIHSHAQPLVNNQSLTNERVLSSFSQNKENLNQNFYNVGFKKINNTQYLIFIKNSQEPFILVLNNSFDKSWIAKVNSQIINNHLLVNGFANGWLIDKKGDFTVKIILKVWPWE